MKDEQGLFRLAQMLNTTNLPHDGQGIREILELSCASFQGKVEDPEKRIYIFVLEDTQTKQVVGTSQIIARHGSPEDPHLFFEIEAISQYSKSLRKGREHKNLHLKQESKGYTELGGFIIDPDYRHKPVKLGRMLSMIRFWFIREFPELFQKRLLAELLPEKASEESPFWQALGSRFIPLSYEEADRLSRHDKEFIVALFPKFPVCVSLLPENARQALGVVGEKTLPAKHLLESLGFRYFNRVDPFDAGPHLEMNTADLPEVTLPGSMAFENAFQENARFLFVPS